MQVFVILLLLTSCKPSTSIGVYNRENSRLQTNFRRNEFFHEIEDWFGHVKNQIYEKLYGQTITTTPTFPTEVLNLNKHQLQSRFKNREWLQVNLSTLTFNPDQDWGFRVGNWYFIRKKFKNHKFENNNSDESDFQIQSTIQPINLAKAETGETVDTNDSEVIAFSPTISTTTSFVTQQTTKQSSTQIGSFENSLSRTQTPSEDNETNTDFIYRGSVEVLMG